MYANTPPTPHLNLFKRRLHEKNKQSQTKSTLPITYNTHHPLPSTGESPPGYQMMNVCKAGDRFGHHALWLWSFRASGNENEYNWALDCSQSPFIRTNMWAAKAWENRRTAEEATEHNA